MRRVFPLLIMLLVPATAHAQSGKATWTRARERVPPPARVFHSPHAVNLPTAATYQGGLFQFEISHRFLPPYSGGFDQLYGLDGPVNIRLGLGYAVSDHFSVNVARSNVLDNVDLQLKYGSLRLRNSGSPVELGLVAGAAWNTDNPSPFSTGSRDIQLYGQFILNAMIVQPLALGVVPSYLYNAILESEEVEHALTLGLYGQYYVTRLLSVLVEWNITEAGYYYKYDAVAFGIELETGGHFFKIITTNSVRLNPSLHLVGTNDKFEPDEWRLGFNITRLLHF